MTESQEYKLRWRGRETGPFALPEILRKLDDHEIGMGHEIRSHGKWITLDEFLASPPEQPAPPPAPPTGGLPFASQVTSPATPVPTPALREKPLPQRSNVPAPAPARIAPAMTGGKTPVLRPRRRMVFALLGVFFGFAGVHNYYARQWLTGLLQLLLSVATFLMGFGIIASWAWAMVEAIVVRKDGDSIEMI